MYKLIKMMKSVIVAESEKFHPDRDTYFAMLERFTNDTKDIKGIILLIVAE